MKDRIKINIVATLLSLGVIGSAVAADLRWLEYSPVRYFTDKDWEIARAAGREALNDTEDGVTVEWKNPESSNHGNLTPLSTTIKNGMTCRELKIINHTRNLDGSSIYEFCQKPDGKWAAVQGSPN